MFNILSLGLAAAIGTQPIMVDGDRPAVGIDLAGYNLREDQDVRRVQLKIREAARSVCVRGYRVAIYEERVACVKSAIADGNQQLRRIVAKDSASLAAAAVISISIK